MVFNNTAATKKTRYRTIQECHEELLRIDEHCKISVYCIRLLCKENKIEYIPVGSKKIVNLDSLLAYLGMSDTPAQTAEQPPAYAVKFSKYKPRFEYGAVPCDIVNYNS